VAKEFVDTVPPIRVGPKAAYLANTPIEISISAELNWVRFYRSPDEAEALDGLVWGITGHKPAKRP
jgi:hypothetical protein